MPRLLEVTLPWLALRPTSNVSAPGAVRGSRREGWRPCLFIPARYDTADTPFTEHSGLLRSCLLETEAQCSACSCQAIGPLRERANSSQRRQLPSYAVAQANGREPRMRTLAMRFVLILAWAAAHHAVAQSAPPPEVHYARISPRVAVSAAIDGEAIASGLAVYHDVWRIESDDFALTVGFTGEFYAFVLKAEWRPYKETFPYFAEVWLADVRAQWPTGLSIVIENAGTAGLSINWEQSAFVDHGGRSSRLIHSGTPFVLMQNPVSPTFVPPSASVSDVIAPVSSVVLDRGKWALTPMFGDTQEGGRLFSLFFTVVSGDKPHAVSLEFTASRSILLVDE